MWRSKARPYTTADMEALYPLWTDIKVGPAMDWIVGVPPERPARRSHPMLSHPMFLVALTVIATIAVCRAVAVIRGASADALLMSCGYVAALMVYRSLLKSFSSRSSCIHHAPRRQQGRASAIGVTRWHGCGCYRVCHAQEVRRRNREISTPALSAE